MKYIIVDTMNLFFRCKHIAGNKADPWLKIGMAMHLTLMSTTKMFKDHNGDHVVFVTEGKGSWRREIYEQYKNNRKVARAALTEEQQEEDKLFFEAYLDLVKFLDERTNCTVLNVPRAEGDDLIARWIQTHPEDEHVIISTDSDFVQLLAPNVSQFNGVSERLYTIDGVFDVKGKPVIDNKTKEPMTVDPEWELFLKCVRGDPGDGIFSAYPGAYLKSTKNRIGIKEAYEDKVSKGYAWNNFMLQRWVDHNDVEHRVLDDYERNCMLIDLTKQPADIVQAIDAAIKQAEQKPVKQMVGAHLLKFCAKYELNSIAKFPTDVANCLNSINPNPKTETK